MEPTIEWMKEKFGINNEMIAAKHSEEKAQQIADAAGKVESLKAQLLEAETAHQALVGTPEEATETLPEENAEPQG